MDRNSLKKRPAEDQARRTKRKKVSQDETLAFGHAALAQDRPSLFHMQMTELLAQMRPKQKQTEQLTQTVEKLKGILLNMSPGKERKLHLRKWMKDVKLPVVEEPKTTKGCFHFRAPVRVFLGGSNTLNTCVNHTADLFVEMPRECFQGKDWLNHRYVRKRAMYLAALTLRLSQCVDFDNMKYTYHRGNHYKPIVMLTIPDKGSAVNINLHAVPEKDVFKPSRFDIRKNNVRPSWFSGQQQDEMDDGNDETCSLPATPVYSSSILQDICCDANEEFLKTSLQGTPAIQDAIALLKVWLHQRELDVGYGSMSGFLLSMYVCHLIRQGVILHSMDTLQVMRHTLAQLSKQSWLEQPVVLCSEVGQDKRPSIDHFVQVFDVVFIDVTGYLNLALGMTKALYNRVCHEASLAVQCLTNNTSEHFDHFFITPCPFHLKFDYTFTVTLTPETLDKVIEKLDLSSQVLDHGGAVASMVIPGMLDILEQGLGDRVLLLQPRPEPSLVWSVTEEPPPLMGDHTLTFGLLQHKTNSLRLLDRGPPANVPEAVKFQQLWGEKSELRRFQDGGILEAVVWSTSSTLSQKRKVCSKIISHVLNRHAAIRDSDIHPVGCNLEDVLHVPQSILRQTGVDSGGQYGTGEERIYKIRQTLDELSKTLKGLPDLALRINSVSGIHPVFRFSEVFPAHPAVKKFTSESLLKDEKSPLPLYSPAMTVICSLEGSGHWPEDLDRLQDMKTLYLIDIGQKLMQIGFTVNVQRDYVDVLKSGFIFRLKLGVIREVALLRKKSVGGMLKMEDTPEALALEAEISMFPEMTTVLQGVQQEHPSFSVTVRLIKRWISAQLLLGHIPELIVERMVMHLFNNPLPFTAPVSPQIGFFRFLQWVSRKDCNMETFCDKVTKPPHPVVMNWLRTVAMQSLKVLQSQPDSEWKVIFKPPLDVYDVVIRLSPQSMSRRHQQVEAKVSMAAYHQNKKPSEDTSMPVTDFNPPEMFLKTLQVKYGEFALFFHDQYGGNVIAVLFKPDKLQLKEPKNNKSNLDTMLEDLTAMSKDMVTKVDINRPLS